MFKKLSVSAAAIISLASLSFAAVNFDGPQAGSLMEEIKGVDVPAAVPADKGLLSWLSSLRTKEWTIMVYINGKNNLEKFALKDMNEMELVGSSDKVNVVVEVGRMEGFDSSDGDWKGTRRYLITKDTDTEKVNSTMVQDLGKTDMGDYKNVAAFGKWAKAKYPSKKTMLVIWNHGAGWVKSRSFAGSTKGISYDDETNNHINTPQMGALLKDMGGVDVYGSDACLMQMAEVVYEIKNYVPYIVGSEETEPGDGYTYNDLLAPLVAKPTMTAEEFGKVAVSAYSDHYAGINEGSTQSLIRSAAIPGFLAAADEFAGAVTKAGEKELAKTSMGAAQAYAYPENKDLYHFAQLMVAGTKDAEVKAKGEALMSYIKDTLVVINKTTNGAGGGWWAPPADYTNSHGIAVYLPGAAVPAAYNELQWARYSGWDEFINWLAQP